MDQQGVREEARLVGMVNSSKFDLVSLMDVIIPNLKRREILWKVYLLWSICLQGIAVGRGKRTKRARLIALTIGRLWYRNDVCFAVDPILSGHDNCDCSIYSNGDRHLTRLSPSRDNFRTYRHHSIHV